MMVAGGRENVMNDEAWLFVYGTLQPGMSNYGVIEAWVREAARGRVRGCLVDAAAGLYPALVIFPEAGDSGAVSGWWLRIGIGGLAETDRLEEYGGPEESNDYERIWTADADAPSRQGWVYVWPTRRGCPAIGSSKWPPSPD